MDRGQALDYLRRNHQGVLSTQKRDGRPQLSNVSYWYDDADGCVKVSVTRDRAKTRNVRRDPRVSMLVVGENWYEYLVVEGKADLLEDDTVPELRRVYEGVRGEPHPDWEEFDAAMERDGRLVLRFGVERLYPLE